MQALKRQIQHAAETDIDITILIQGETGTGKELIAEAIHQKSRRKDKPFIAINCAAIPASLIESELFGHVKGAFTGATQEHKGIFEQADGGTLFLDEIGEMPLDQQPKLLRVLQEKAVRRLGSEEPHPIAVDVKFIAATNQELTDLVRIGQFREDLYYRLAAFDITVPPLRQRGSDIMRLAYHFLGDSRSFTETAQKALTQYSWPGNVRELRNAISRAVAQPTNPITPELLPAAITSPDAASPSPLPAINPSETGIETRIRQIVREELAYQRNPSNGIAENRLEALCATPDFASAISSDDLKGAEKALRRFLIRTIRHDYTQTETAERLGVSLSTVKRYEK